LFVECGRYRSQFCIEWLGPHLWLSVPVATALNFRRHSSLQVGAVTEPGAVATALNNEEGDARNPNQRRDYLR